VSDIVRLNDRKTDNWLFGEFLLVTYYYSSHQLFIKA